MYARIQAGSAVMLSAICHMIERSFARRESTSSPQLYCSTDERIQFPHVATLPDYLFIRAIVLEAPRLET